MTRSFSITFLLLVSVATAVSQQQSPKTEEDLKLQREHLQAISMVQQSGDEALLWDNKKAAIQVLADAADLLWADSPSRGTNWLTKAWELIDKVSGMPKDEKLKDFFTRSDQSELRNIVLSVARRRDPELAEKFLKQLSQKEPREKKDRGAFDDRTARSEQLLQMAQQAVESTPEVAFSLAERSLADGISYSLQSVLIGLRKKNAELANRLFDMAVARFRSFPSDPSEAQVLAGYLFQSGFTFSTNSSGQTILAVNPTQRNLPAVAASEPQRARNFLVAVYEVLLTRPSALDSAEGKQRAQQTLVLGNRLAGPYRTFAPELVPSVQGFMASLQRQLMFDAGENGLSEAHRPATPSVNTTKRSSSEEIYERRMSELEDNAEKQSNPIARKLAYVEAAVATRPDEYQRGKRIAEKIDDDNLRPDVVSFLLYRGALFLIQKSELDKAAELAPKISDVARRAVVKIAIARSLSSDALDQERALALLNDVERDLRKEEPSARVAKIALGRAALMAKLDKEQALPALEQAVAIINKLDAFDLRDEAAPDLGLAAFSAADATLAAPRLGFSFRSAIGPLVPAQFERVAAVAGRFTARELSALARLETAKLFLLGTQRPSKNSAVVVR
ncbi:MAG: hypothetical protein ACXWID_13805 [Pyrinomonadaceae bacterium]